VIFKQENSVGIKGLPHLMRLRHPDTEGAQSKFDNYTQPKAAVESIRAVLMWSVLIGWETSVIPQPCSVGIPDHMFLMEYS
jgi:predicted RNA-binding protein with PUA-like domain